MFNLEVRVATPENGSRRVEASVTDVRIDSRGNLHFDLEDGITEVCYAAGHWLGYTCKEIEGK